MVTKREAQKRARRAFSILEKKYNRSLKPDTRSVLTQLLFQIIARNFTFTGADRAMTKLQATFVDWNEVRISSVSEIAAVLESVRAPNPEKKAKNIKKILIDVFHEQHKISLDFLTDLTEEKAEEVLHQIRGASPGVIDNVMLFALKHPIVPKYSPIGRVCRRLEIVPRDATQDQIANALSRYVPRRDVERFSRLLIEHADKTCTFKAPKCTKCLFARFCNYPKLLAQRERERKQEKKEAERAKAKAKAEAKKAAAKAKAASKKEAAAAAASKKKAAAKKKKKSTTTASRTRKKSATGKPQHSRSKPTSKAKAKRSATKAKSKKTSKAKTSTKKKKATTASRSKSKATTKKATTKKKATKKATKKKATKKSAARSKPKPAKSSRSKSKGRSAAGRSKAKRGGKRSTARARAR